MSEVELWTLLQKHLPGMSERIENGVACGTPDVYNCTNGHSTWIELKHLKRLENLDILHLGLHPSQRSWHINHHRNGGWSFVLTRVNDTFYLHWYDIGGFFRVFIMAKPYNWEGLLEKLFLKTVFTNVKPGL